MASINRVVLVGNLTRDPEQRTLPSGSNVTELGIAVNHRYKNRQTDQWVEEPNYFNIVVFGAQGDACNQYLSKGRPVAVDGRLRFSSWDDKNGGGKRSKVDVVADTVQFLGSRGDDSGQANANQQALGGCGLLGDQPRDDRASLRTPSSRLPQERLGGVRVMVSRMSAHQQKVFGPFCGKVSRKCPLNGANRDALISPKAEVTSSKSCRVRHLPPIVTPTRHSRHSAAALECAREGGDAIGFKRQAANSNVCRFTSN